MFEGIKNNIINSNFYQERVKKNIQNGILPRGFTKEKLVLYIKKHNLLAELKLYDNFFITSDEEFLHSFLSFYFSVGLEFDLLLSNFSRDAWTQSNILLLFDQVKEGNVEFENINKANFIDKLVAMSSNEEYVDDIFMLVEKDPSIIPFFSKSEVLLKKVILEKRFDLISYFNEYVYSDLLNDEEVLKVFRERYNSYSTINISYFDYLPISIITEKELDKGNFSVLSKFNNELLKRVFEKEKYCSLIMDYISNNNSLPFEQQYLLSSKELVNYVLKYNAKNIVRFNSNVINELLKDEKILDNVYMALKDSKDFLCSMGANDIFFDKCVKERNSNLVNRFDSDIILPYFFTKDKNFMNITYSLFNEDRRKKIFNIIMNDLSLTSKLSSELVNQIFTDEVIVDIMKKNRSELSAFLCREDLVKKTIDLCEKNPIFKNNIYSVLICCDNRYLDYNIFEKYLSEISNNPTWLNSYSDEFYEKMTINTSNFLQQIMKNNDENKKRSFISLIENLVSDKKYFKFVLKSLNNNRDLINEFDSNFKDLFKNTFSLIDEYGIVNVLDINTILSMDFMLYVYPNLSKELVFDLLNYSTNAAENIINEIKNGNLEFIKELYEFARKTSLFPIANSINGSMVHNDKFIHRLFSSLDKNKELLIDVLKNKDKLSKEDIDNLRCIFRSKNYFGINTFNDLQNYQIISKEKLNSYLFGKTLEEKKDILAKLFSFDNFDSMRGILTDYSLDNYVAHNEVRKEIISRYGEENGKLMLDDIVYTYEDVAIIKLLKKIINTNNEKELDDIINNCTSIDISLYIDNIVQKLRNLYNCQLASRFSDISGLKGERVDDINVLSMDMDKFFFLIHQLQGVDHADLAKMIINDPSLLFKMQGATTLSTSTLSEKGVFSSGHIYDTSIYLMYNHVPENFLLFQQNYDAWTDRRYMQIDPYGFGRFCSIDAIVQNSTPLSSYNEVSGWRNGMIPSALAVFGDSPNEDVIKIAKALTEYYQSVLGMDYEVPIVKFDMKKYLDRLPIRIEENKRKYNDTLDNEYLKELFYDGSNNFIPEDERVTHLHETVDFCIKAIMSKLENGDIDFLMVIRKLNEIERIISQFISFNEKYKLELKRVVTLRYEFTKKVKLSDIQNISVELKDIGSEMDEINIVQNL